jgi:hypothetical protein
MLKRTNMFIPNLSTLVQQLYNSTGSKIKEDIPIFHCMGEGRE